MTYRFPRADTRPVLLGLRWPQLAVLTVTATVALGLLITMPSIVGLAAAVAALTAGAVVVGVRPGGRPVEEWVPIALRWYAGGARTRRAPRPAVPPPPPLAGITLHAAHHPNHPTPIGLIADRHTGAWTAVIELDGTDLTHNNPDEAAHRAAAWGTYLDTLPTDVGLRVTWLHTATPIRPNDDLPEAIDADPADPTWASYLQLLGALTGDARTHRSHLAYTITPPRRALRLRSDEPSTAAEAAVDLALRAGELLAPAGLRVARVLDREAVVDLFARAFDPTRPTGTSCPWPTRTDETADTYRTDRTLHATFWVADWPRRDVPVGFLDELLTFPNETVRFALTIEPDNPTAATRRVRAARAGRLADDELRQRSGYLDSVERGNEQQRLAEHEQHLADGHHDHRYAGHLTITATTPEDLDKLAAAVTTASAAAQLEIRRLWGEQADAFTTTLPLGRGLQR